MPDEYYALPLQFSDILKKQQLKKVDVFDSICFNIRLILRSHFGENRFDYSYGCAVWERDFEIIQSNTDWCKELSSSIVLALNKHEKRLQNIKAETIISEEEFINTNGDNVTHRIKRKITVKIMGNFYRTNMPFERKEVLYISPLSIEEYNS